MMLTETAELTFDFQIQYAVTESIWDLLNDKTSS